MKKTVRFFVIFMIAALFLGALPAFADEWNEDYFRASDVSDEVTDEEQEFLDKTCIEFMQKYGYDAALVAVTSDYTDDDIEGYAEDYYSRCKFGYGDDGSGFLMVYDLDTDEAYIAAFGGAVGVIDETYINLMETSIPMYRGEYGVYGVMYSTTVLLDDYMKKLNGEDDDATVGETAEMPDWYPEDPQSFEFYHDEKAPRVVDTADIFTGEEEAALEARIAEIREEIDRDIVIFTDVSTYGLSREVYAADFYDFNGYGCGDDREGVCLLICMDPAERGWWCACTGDDTVGLYTREYSSMIDSDLREYLAAGEYGEGVSDWVENIYTLYVKGMPFAPEWFPDRDEDFERFHDADRDRIDDAAGFFTAEEAADLRERAKAISDKYGVDVIIHTTNDTYCFASREYANYYYRYLGYGEGEDYDGISLTMFGSKYLATYAEGSPRQKLTDVNLERLEDQSAAIAANGDYYEAAVKWLSNVEKMEAKGRVPRTLASWLGTTVFGSLLGLGGGGITLSSANRKMSAPRTKRTANAYLVRDSLSINKAGDSFMYSEHASVYDPVRHSSSGGSSSGGGSSFSSSYSGSSGASHSGSGGTF